MPFADRENPAKIEGVDPHAYVPPELTWRPDLSSVAQSFLDYELTFGSTARAVGERWSLAYARRSGWDTIDESYSAFDDPDVLAMVQERPELASNFSFSQSRFESSLIRRNIAREDEANETMSMAGPGGVALMLSMGFVDPVNLVPGAALGRAWQAGRVLRGSAEGATAGLASAIAAEGILQGSQATRGAEDSLVNIAASTLLSGALGAGVSLIPRGAAREVLAEGVANDVKQARAAAQGAAILPGETTLSGTVHDVLPLLDVLPGRIDTTHRVAMTPTGDVTGAAAGLDPYLLSRLEALGVPRIEAEKVAQLGRILDWEFVIESLQSGGPGGQGYRVKVGRLTLEDAQRVGRTWKRIDDIIRRIAPKGYESGLYTKIEVVGDSATIVTGAHDRLNKIIMLSLESPDLIHTTRHESIHALRSQGLFTDAEWATLSEAAINQGWLDKRYGGWDQTIRERYGSISKLKQIEEAIAEEFAEHRKDLFARVPEPLRGIFLKLHQLLTDIADAVRRAFGGDLPNAAAIFRAIERGEIARRGAPDWVDVVRADGAVGALQARRVDGPQGGGGSVGAAARRATTLEDETRIGTGIRVERAGELPVVGNPMGRLSASPSLMVRRIARQLTETAYHYRDEAKGVSAPQAAETLSKLHEFPLAAALGKIDDAFSLHRFGKVLFGKKIKAGVEDISGQRDPNKLSYEQFMDRAGMAMRRADTDAIPEVDAAAKLGREVDERLKNEAIAVGLFTEDVRTTTAESHFHRVYNTEKIKAERPTFEGIIFDWVKGLKAKSEERAAQVAAWSRISTKAKANLDRLESEIAKAQDFDATGMYQKGRAAQKQAGKLQRELDVRQQRIDKLKRRLATAQERQVRPTDRLPDTDELVQLLNDARHMKEPQRIIERVREMGGIRDTDGVLASRGFKPIKKRNGKPLRTKDWRIEIIDTEATSADARGTDQVARILAEEDGFLQRTVDVDGAVEDPHIDDLVEALERDAFGEAVYGEYGPHREDVTRWREAQATKLELERQEIDLSWSNERIASELGLIDNFVPDTPAARERLRQAQFYERRIADDLKAEEAAYREVVAKLGAASADASDTLGRARRMRGKIDGLKRERSASKRAHERYSKLVEADREIDIMTDADLRDIARQVTDKVLGHEDAGAFEFDATPNLRGALRERTLTIPDFRIEDYLENNIETVLRKQTRQMGADIELTRAFGRPDMVDQFDEIRQEYAKVRAGVPEGKQQAELDRRMKQDIEDLALIRDRIRGTAGVPEDPDAMLYRGFKVVRGLNYLRLMGGATWASLADAGAVVFRHGMGRVMANGIGPLMSNLRQFKLSQGEVRRGGTGLDVVLDTRAMNLAEIGDDWGKNSRLERGIQWATNKFGIVNALSLWTAWWKQFDGVIGHTRILEEAERLRLGTATPEEREHLAWLGIDFDMATRIDLQQQAHGTKAEGIRTANTERWDDAEAMRAIHAALTKEVDVTIVTPGAGDRPSWMSTPWGKVIGQFKSFSLSAMSRVTAEGMQRRDAAALQGMVMMVTMGMLSYYVKTRDEDIDWDNPATWIKEGVDRSGVTGWLFDALNTQEKILGGLGINAAIGSPSARYASRNATGALLGPTFGLGEDALRFLGNAANGNLSASDVHRWRKTLPGQNLFYLRGMFDRAEEAFTETLGIPDRRKKFKKRNDY